MKVKVLRVIVVLMFLVTIIGCDDNHVYDSYDDEGNFISYPEEGSETIIGGG